MGVLALWLIWRHMPDYRGDAPHPLDVKGLLLFGSGTALISWLLEIFGEHEISAHAAAGWLVVASILLGLYVRHARRIAHPLLNLKLFSLRTFRVSVAGGFVTRFGVGALPFLLPLLYQLGLGFPAWQSGMLMMPIAIAAMGMKFISTRLLRRFGYRTVLMVNTVMIGITICGYATVGQTTPIHIIILLGLAQGFFNSLQFSSMNTMAYADIEGKDSSQASTLASSLQQLSMSFGLAFGSLVAGWYLGGLPQTDHAAVTAALHHAFLTMGALTMLSGVSFLALKSGDGDSVSRGTMKAAEISA